jgi:hypothetical protein
MKNNIVNTMLLSLILVCTSSIAQSKSAECRSMDKVAQQIPYQDGNKNPHIVAVEKALEQHPMLSAALRGVVATNDHCILWSFSSEKRPREELLSTQFNGGELNVALVYFCFIHTEEEIREGIENENSWKGDGPPGMADVVLTVSGNYSERERKIIDPSISYTSCYGHFCGSI